MKTTENFHEAWSQDQAEMVENLRRRFDEYTQDLRSESDARRTDVTLDQRFVLVEYSRDHGTHWVTIHRSEYDAAGYVAGSLGESWEPRECVDLLDGQVYRFETRVMPHQADDVVRWSK